MDPNVAMVLCALFSGISAIVVALIGSNIKKENKKSDEREAKRREESLLSLEMMDATLQLSIVTSNALTNGHNNGNVGEARLAAQKAQSAYKQFEQRLVADLTTL